MLASYQEDLKSSSFLQDFLKSNGFLVKYFISEDIDSRTIPSELSVLLLEHYAVHHNNKELKAKMITMAALGMRSFVEN